MSALVDAPRKSYGWNLRNDCPSPTKNERRRSSLVTLDFSDSMHSRTSSKYVSERCQTCGVLTHDVTYTKTKKQSFFGWKRRESQLMPLTNEGTVLDGKCLKCHPVSSESNDQDRMVDDPKEEQSEKENAEGNGEEDSVGGSGEDESEAASNNSTAVPKKLYKVPWENSGIASSKLQKDPGITLQGLNKVDLGASMNSLGEITVSRTGYEDIEEEDEAEDWDVYDSDSPDQVDRVPLIVTVDYSQVQDCDEFGGSADPENWALPWPLKQEDEISIQSLEEENTASATSNHANHMSGSTSLHMSAHALTQETSSASSHQRDGSVSGRSAGDRSISLADLIPKGQNKHDSCLTTQEVSVGSKLHMSHCLHNDSVSNLRIMTDMLNAPDVTTWMQEFADKCRESDGFRSEAAAQGGIEAVLSVMRTQRDNVDIQEQGCMALHALAKDYGSAIAKQWGIDCLIYTIDRHGKDSHRLLGFACGALMYVAMRDSYKGYVARKGGVTAILTAMEHHMNNLNVQQQCFAALLRLSPNRDTIDALVDPKQMGFSIMIKTMNAHSTDAMLLQFGSGVLRSIAAHKEVAVPILVDEGATATLVGAIKSHPKSENLQEQACWALHEIALTEIISHDRAVKAVLNAMKTHDENAYIQQYGCGLLKQLSESKKNMRKIEKLDGITTILDAMQKHLSNAEVQRFGLGALVPLLTSNTNQDLMVRKGGVTSVIEAMKTHRVDGSIQREGCGVLRNLSVHDASKGLIETHGGIAAILIAMTLGLNDSSLQQRACGALLNFSRSSELSKAIVTFEGIGVIIAVMKHHDTDVKLQRYACTMLKNLAVDTELSRAVATNKGIPAILAAMKGHAGEAKLQAKACGALKNLAGNTENKQDIAKHEVVVAILSCMEEHASDVDVQRAACAAIFSLANVEKISVCIGRYEGIQKILACIQRHAKNWNVLSEALGALWKLTSSNENLQKFGELSGVALLVKKMDEQISNAAVQYRACLVLTNMALKDSCRSKLLETGAIEAIVSAMEFHGKDAQVQKYGCKFLWAVMLQSNSDTKQVMKVRSAVQAALKNHAGNGAVERYAIRALEAISSDSNGGGENGSLRTISTDC